VPAQVEPCWSTTPLVVDLMVGQLFCISTWNPARVEQLRQFVAQAGDRTAQLRNSATDTCERAPATVAIAKAGREERRRRAEHARGGVSAGSSPPGSRDSNSSGVGE
jgi:hypothetical protein